MGEAERHLELLGTLGIGGGSFEPGADSMLADWGQITTYLTSVAEASPLVRLDTLGRTGTASGRKSPLPEFCAQLGWTSFA